MGCITKKELVVLEEFRRRLVDVLTDVDDFNRRDDSLIRWLRARDMKVDKAEEMFRNSLKWRAENDINRILDWTDPEMESKFPYYLDGVDKKGRPVITFPFGLWDVRTFVETEGGFEKYCRYYQQLMERVLYKIKQRTLEAGNSKNIDEERVTEGMQFVAIVDLTGYSYWQLANMKAVHATVKNISAFEAYYPETVGEFLVINAPRVFPILFGIIKPFMTGRTLDKISIFSSNKDEWQKTVLEVVAADQVREPYGGTKIP